MSQPIFWRNVEEFIGAKAKDGTPVEVAGRLYNFGTGKVDMVADHSGWLDQRIIEEVLKRPHPWVDVIGYASKLGDPVKNQRLSEARAQKVKDYIVAGLRKKGRAPEGLITPQPSRGEFGEGYETTNTRDDDEKWRAVDVYVYAAKPPSINILPPVEINIVTPLPVSDWKITPGASESGGRGIVTFTEGSFIFENLTLGDSYKANYVGGGRSLGPLPVSLTVSTDSMYGWGSRIKALKPIRTIEDLIRGPSLMVVGSIASLPASLLTLLFGHSAIGGGYAIIILLNVNSVPTAVGISDIFKIIKSGGVTGVAAMIGAQGGADISVSGVAVKYHSYHKV